MANPLRFHPEVGGEAQGAYDYYQERSVEAANRLADALDAAYDAIEDHPERYATYEYGPDTCQYRRVDNYPYLVIYERQERVTVVYAVAHTSRKPAYWAERVQDD